MKSNAVEEPYEYPRDWSATRERSSQTGQSARPARSALQTPPRSTLRRLVLVSGLALCALGGAPAWRALHPPLSDAERIGAQLEELRVAVEKRSATGVTKYLASDFAWNGTDLKTFRAGLGHVFSQWREARLLFFERRVAVRGDQATATGRYSLTMRESPGAPWRTFSGDFSLQWQRRGGDWQITQARGGENLPLASDEF